MAGLLLDDVDDDPRAGARDGDVEGRDPMSQHTEARKILKFMEEHLGDWTAAGLANAMNADVVLIHRELARLSADDLVVREGDHFRPADPEFDGDGGDLMSTVECRACRGVGALRYFPDSGRVKPIDRRETFYTPFLIRLGKVRVIRCMECDGTGEIDAPPGRRTRHGGDVKDYAGQRSEVKDV